MTMKIERDREVCPGLVASHELRAINEKTADSKGYHAGMEKGFFYGPFTSPVPASAPQQLFLRSLLPRSCSLPCAIPVMY